MITSRPRSLPQSVRAFAETALMVALATLAGALAAPRWGTGAVDLLYLLPVLAAAALYGLWPALFAAAAAVLAFNYFFTVPVGTFRISEPADIVTALTLFAVALVTGRLAAAMREHARVAAARASRNATIAGFAGGLLSRSGAGDIAGFACRELAGLFGCQAVLMAGERPEPLARAPDSAPLTPADLATAAWVLAHGESAGRGSPRLDPAEWRFFPVHAAGRTLAAVGLARDDGRAPVADDQQPLLDSLLDQIALALARASLEAELRDVGQLRERDRLRGALLSSVGHDLRTPLTAIAASAAELRRAGTRADPALVATLESETEKLGRYITNLLDMARIEAGAVTMRSEPVDLVDAVAAATGDLARALAGRTVAVDLPPDLPLVRTDPDLLHHILINLLDNAAAYSAAGRPIRIAGRRETDAVALTIEDEGSGAPAVPLDRFERIEGSDRKGGAGLGLAIVRNFSAAIGVRAEPRPRAEGGTCFALVFPAALLVAEPVGEGA